MERVEKRNVSAQTAWGNQRWTKVIDMRDDVTEVFHFGAVQNQKGRYTIGLNSHVSKLV